MRYIGGIINILIGLAIIFFGYIGLSNYFGGAQEKINKLEAFLSNGTKTMAIVDDEYTETTIKGISIYSSKYFFKVDDKEYSGKFYFDSPEELEPVIQAYYMPNDPSKNTVNIEKELAEAKEDTESNFDLYLGIVACLVGLLFIYFGGIRRFLPAKETA